MRLGSIYLITCLCTEKVYIGQTVLNPPMKRWIEHYEDSKKSELFLHRAMKKFGIENFTFRILEQKIPLEKLNEREIYYIDKYNANNKEFGYNLTKGGQFTHASKLSEEFVKKIIEVIKNEPEKSFVEIGKIYGIDRALVSDINCGDIWYFSDEDYPIRKNCKWRGVLSEEDILNIYEMLRNKTSLTDIAKKYGVTITNISNINLGKVHKYLDAKEYPIFKPVNSSKRLSLEMVQKVVHKLETTKDVYSKIGNELGIGRKTVSAINNGTLYLDKIKEVGITKFPIRK